MSQPKKTNKIKDEAACLKELSWKEARNDIKHVNAELFKIIEELNPGKDYTLFKARYPFGSESVKNGILHLPNPQGRIVPYTDHTIHSQIQEKLGYNVGTNPVSILIKNCMELFMPMESHAAPFPYGLIQPGAVFSTSRILNPELPYQPAFLWSISSGARSLFMLPKIGKDAGYKRLRKEFSVRTDKPTTLSDQWEIFKDLANHETLGANWFAETIYFSKKWFEKLFDKAWQEFRLYLLQSSWDRTEFWRNQFIWSLVFSIIQHQRNLKPNQYIADTIKHVLSIGAGAVPGFAPALNDEAAPIEFLQRIFSDVYRLDKYPPIIMQLESFALYKPHRPVYYSLHYPSLLEFAPRSRQNPSTITELYEVKSLLDKYIIAILSGNLNLAGSPLYDIAKEVNFDFFHTDVTEYSGMKHSSEIPKEDKNFLINQNSPFPVNSTFTRGCVRISHKVIK